MAMSFQKKISKTRKPRVHITYDVDDNGATVKKEIPFVVGVLGDYSGNNPGKKPKSFKDRKFIDVDSENFNTVLKGMTPGVKYKVKNTIKDDDSELSVDLKFDSMDDFKPAAIVDQVEPLKQLLEARNKLRDILAKSDTSEELEVGLEEILQNTEHLDKLAEELGVKKEEGE